MINLYRGTAGVDGGKPWFSSIVDALGHYAGAQTLYILQVSHGDLALFEGDRRRVVLRDVDEDVSKELEDRVFNMPAALFCFQ